MSINNYSDEQLLKELLKRNKPSAGPKKKQYMLIMFLNL